MQEIDIYRNIGSAGMLIGNVKLLFIFVDDEGSTSWKQEHRESVEVVLSVIFSWPVILILHYFDKGIVF